MNRFSSFDGTQIAFEVLGEGEPVVMLHGFASDSRTNFVRPGVAQAVVDSGRRVVLIDARGHGESGKPHDPAAYGKGAMVRDVQGLLDCLHIERFDLVGYSMGAFVAVKLAPLEPRLRSLVLGGVGLAQLRRPPGDAIRIAEALEAPDPASIAAPTPRSFRNFADATHADRFALAALQRGGDFFPAEAELGLVTVPTLVLNGAKDTLAGDPAPLAAAIPAGRSETVPGDHLSAVVQPEFRQAVVRFLESV